jgi:hypothetical protein
MSEVETVTRAEQTLRDLEQKRVKLSARADQISEARKAVGYAAYAEHDKTAKQKLAVLNAEANTLSGELEAITAALTEATARLNAAKASVAAAEDRAKAGKLRTVLESAAARAVEIDAILSSAVAELSELFTDIRQFRALGEQFPTDEQFKVNTLLAIKSFLMQLPPLVARDFEFLPPNQRRTFTSIFQHMIGPIEQRIKARLGEAEQEAA